MSIDFNQFIENTEGLGVLGVLVTKDGEESEWLYEADIRRNVYSAAKSFVSAAVGFALNEGLLALEEKLTERLSGKGRALFLRSCDAFAEFKGESELETFTTGFRLGARLMLDTFLSDDAPFESYLEG